MSKSKEKRFYSYKAIFDMPISTNAKMIYMYLCRCADGNSQSYPSHRVIGEKCGIKSRQTVSDAIKELEKHNLLTKAKRTTKYGGQTSNMYTVRPVPDAEPEPKPEAETPVQPLDTPCPIIGHPLSNHWTPPVQPLDTPCPIIGHEGGSFEGGFTEGGKKTPLASNVYGVNKLVRLTPDEYARLKGQFGEETLKEYIIDLDLWLSSTGNTRKNHCSTIELWIRRNSEEEQQRQQKPKKNRFNNFEGRKRDYAQIERMERQYLMESIKNELPQT